MTDSRRRQNRPTFHQHHVQADAKGGYPPGTPDGVLGGRTGNHQARRGKNTVAMRGLDGIIDLEGGTEIVSRDDESWPPLRAQAISRRVRRKRKNSTPSRKRRFIISGLATISATIEAILEGRK